MQIKFLAILALNLFITSFNITAASVEFFDRQLERAVREQWEKATKKKLSIPPTKTELADPLFTQLTATDLNITSLVGLEACTSLKKLNVARNAFTDLNPISELITLTDLELGVGLSNNGDVETTYTNQIRSLTSLRKLTNLSLLDIAGNIEITDISILANLQNLKTLIIGHNSIKDFSPLKNVSATLRTFISVRSGLKNRDIQIINALTKLNRLVLLHDANVTDLANLKALNFLTAFSAVDLPFGNTLFLRNLKNLKEISIVGARLQSLTGIETLHKLRYAYISENQLTDISALNGLPHLKVLELEGNAIENIDAIESLKKLSYLDIRGNQITNLQAIINNNEIKDDFELYVQNNMLTSSTAYQQIALMRKRLKNGIFEYEVESPPDQ